MVDSDLALSVRLLTQIQSEFDRLRWQAMPVRIQLVHMATNAEAEGVRGFPKGSADFVAMQGAGHREGGLRYDKKGAVLFRDDPVVDVEGKPIANSAGEYFDFIMPAHRSVLFDGKNEDYHRLAAIAERAGRLVARINLPLMNLLQGWQFSTASDLWWALLFELAWNRLHPLVFAERRIWLPDDRPNFFLPYDLEQVKGLATTGFGLNGRVPEAWLKRLPEAWVSNLDDAVTASLDAVNYLLTQLTPIPTTQTTDRQTEPPSEPVDAKESKMVTLRRRFAIALSFPGEHRSLVEKIARSLRDAFGEQRVFYDKFHEVELSRPNLDLALQRIYGEESDLVVVFVCGKYAEKEWCGLEWRSIRSVMKSSKRKDEEVMFLRLDDQPLEGLLDLDGFINISKKKPREIADKLIRRWTTSR